MKDNEITFLKIKWFPKEKNEYFLNELCYGLEEEGVLFDVEKTVDDSKDQSDMETAYYCAASSKFGIGVYISEDGHIIVHYKKLDVEMPYLYTRPYALEEVRMIGSNVGRLLKGQPLRV